jgi:alkaline phosphatase D
MSHDEQGSSRRAFLRDAAVGLVGTALGAGLAEGAEAQAEQLKPVARLPDGVTRHWLGPAFWGNRLQDWRLHQGRLECLQGGESYEVRTVGVLTRSLRPGRAPGRLRVRTGLLTGPGEEGFGGILLGVGGGRLDHRAAALAQRPSGTGGGFMATLGTDGRVRFRDFTAEACPLAYAELPAEVEVEGSPLRPDQEVVLDLEILPRRDGHFDVRLSALDPASGRALARAVRRGVADEQLTGGILLVSSPPTGRAGARWWFRDLQTTGGKIAEHPERALGPVLGTLHSLNGRVLKMSAQLMPVGESEPRSVRLEVSAPGSRARWRPVATAEIQPGYTALFRVPEWDSARDWDYRVVYTPAEGEPFHYTGRIRRDPSDARELRVGLFSCVLAVARTLEVVGQVGTEPQAEIPQAQFLGRYTPEDFYFPYGELIEHAGKHEADLLVFAGDQFYEGNPTRVASREDPGLDYLYKWYLWMWAFREMTRDTPAILLVDDHDVYHPNIWGEGGEKAPAEFWGWNYGGYTGTADFVNTVQRTQCSHNPDPWDPTPVERGITVYYGAFRYGGVDFAMLEDRKWKTSPVYGEDLDVHEPQLLGERQERFLAEWARRPGEAKICLTQSCFACVQTSPNGRALLDFDSNGYPGPGRDRAVALLRDAGALILAGDQHLASVVRHGIEGYADGPVQFSGPAGASFWQRWFEPAQPLPQGTGHPNTGYFKDAFGNRVQVLAVANPKITFAEYRRHVKGRTQSLLDRRLKSEGYGIVRVDREQGAYTLECWPWEVDPAAAGARQFDGWPIRVPFSETRSGE